MIFSIICEELLLFGAVCVILLFVLMLWRMMVIANNAKDLYGALLVTGIMSHIAIQVVLNIAVVTNTIPEYRCHFAVYQLRRYLACIPYGRDGVCVECVKGIRLGYDRVVCRD